MIINKESIVNYFNSGIRDTKDFKIGIEHEKFLFDQNKDKRIILIDDSLVRGTTSHKIVKMLYDAGAKEVHVKIACPEIKYPDFYGVDTPTKKELLAANKTNEEICEYIGAKSLDFLSLQGLYRAIGFEKRNDPYPQLTDHYFTGDYPVKPIDILGDDKITQLSLLSTASGN
jgi:amidophosphoribosyltransferase